jgi:hypothetical protein
VKKIDEVGFLFFIYLGNARKFAQGDGLQDRGGQRIQMCRPILASQVDDVKAAGRLMGSKASTCHGMLDVRIHPPFLFFIIIIHMIIIILLRFLPGRTILFFFSVMVAIDQHAPPKRFPMLT